MSEVWANAHIHLPPNFSAFASAEEAVRQAKIEGCALLGTSNYYDFTVYEAFGALARQVGILPVYGLEVVCMDSDSAAQGTKYNDPANPGKVYLCGKGLRRWRQPTARAAELIQRVRAGDEARMDAMACAMAEQFEPLGVEMPTASRVRSRLAERLGVEERTIVLQERHLAAAAAEAVQSAGAAAFRAVVGLDAEPSAAEDTIRKLWMKAGRPAYIAEDFVSLAEGLELIEELGGMPVYPIVADGVEPPSGVEQSLRTLEPVLKRLSIGHVEFIPNRNSVAVLDRWVRDLTGGGYTVSAGTEHNTSGFLAVRPRCRDGEISAVSAERFWAGAQALYDWQEAR